MADGSQLPLLPGARHARWAPCEIAIMREHYPAGGLDRVKPLLPHRSENAIYMAAVKMKLRAPRQANTTRRLWPHDRMLDDDIRAEARNGGRGSWPRLAKRWGRPLWYIQRRAHDLGVQLPRCDARAWAEAEIELLHATSHLSAGHAALRFRRRGFERTEIAIQHKRHHLAIERSENGIYTERGLSQLLGCSPNVIRRAINDGELRATRERKDDPQSMKHITERALRDWLSAHPYAIDLRRVPPANQALVITALTGANS
jgi:hypothetical protein